MYSQAASSPSFAMLYCTRETTVERMEEDRESRVMILSLNSGFARSAQSAGASSALICSVL